jgi:dehydrogenase/reductase SDR family protein 7B
MKDKVVIITGGSSGIGKALAAEFGKHGSLIFITGRKQGPLLEVRDALVKQGVKAEAFVADSAVEDDNRKMVAECIRIFGRIDILINNAGVSMRALFEDLSLDVFRKVMDTNFYGTVYATKFALSSIIENKGSIVGISSINGKRATPARSAYSASKFAMEGFLESLRTEVFKRGVHVLSACPGFTASNIRHAALTSDGIAQGESPREETKMMSSEEAAHHIYMAVVKRKRDLVLTTQGRLAVFLNKWMPAQMDKIVYNVMAKEPDSPLK